ncbi:MAG TPA: hypothetical protein VFB41_00915 [Solirubrobacteraceae bacterium]|nr:hypothetical protein [Solirubrobacteraceae bacterium]
MGRRRGLAVCLPVAVALAVVLSGCSADGTADGNVTARHDGVPFEYEVPAAFTAESVDQLNTRGDVRGLRALDKVNVVAVRRLARTTPAVRRQRVLGQDVTSEIVPVRGFRGWVFECQYTRDRRSDVQDACRIAAGSVTAVAPAAA